MNKRLDEIEKKMLSVKGGDFIQWHEGLSPVEKLYYSIVFKKLQSRERRK
jgi:hypothetical protein